MRNYLNNVFAPPALSSPVTVQTNPDQVRNDAGGMVYQANPMTLLNRFLILGSEGNNYYASETKLTKENAANVMELIKSNGLEVVKTVVEISDAGRAPKNDPALFVLAMCASFGDDKTRSAALTVLPKVARTGTHLFHFVSYLSSK